MHNLWVHSKTDSQQSPQTSASSGQVSISHATDNCQTCTAGTQKMVQPQQLEELGWITLTKLGKFEKFTRLHKCQDQHLKLRTQNWWPNPQRPARKVAMTSACQTRWRDDVTHITPSSKTRSPQAISFGACAPRWAWAQPYCDDTSKSKVIQTSIIHYIYNKYIYIYIYNIHMSII